MKDEYTVQILIDTLLQNIIVFSASHMTAEKVRGYLFALVKDDDFWNYAEKNLKIAKQVCREQRH